MKRLYGQLSSRHLLPIAAVVCVIVLLAVGALLLHSASGDQLRSVRTHAVQVVLGLGLMALVATIRVAWLKRWSGILLLIGLASALLPFIPGVGVRSGGAVREVAFGPVKWEPGLVLALAVIVWTAAIFAKRPLGMPRRIVALVLVGIAIIIALLQPDFSLVPLMLLPVAMQAWRAGLRGKRAVVLSAALGCIITVTAALQPYVAKRVEAWLEPNKTAEYVGRDYLLLQQGVASGGVTGRGYGKGRYIVQTGVAKSDYFFGHLVEELGLLRGLLILLLYVPILLLGFEISERARDRFVALMGTGMATFLLTAVAIHAAVSLRLIPITAIHLPFLSFGGTSLAASVTAFGLLVAAYRAVNLPTANKGEDTGPLGQTPLS